MLNYYKEIIKNTIRACQIYKKHSLFTINDVNICVRALELLYEQCNELDDFNEEKMNDIKNDLLVIFKSYGTYNIYDLFYLLGDKELIEHLEIYNKYELIKDIVHPIGFKQYPKSKKKYTKSLNKLKLIDDTMIIENSKQLECYDMSRTSGDFYLRVYGIKLILHYKQSVYIIKCIVDDLYLSNLDYDYLIEYKHQFVNDNNHITTYIENMTLKDTLIYNIDEIKYRVEGFLTYYKYIVTIPLSKIAQDFVSSELYEKRQILIKLLLYSNNIEHHYIAYLLYDLLSNDNDESIDSLQQELLYDNLPWKIRQGFRVAMKNTIEYTNRLASFDYNKIPLEQQIALMKTSDDVKEKAMIKLKEIKSKPEDSGGKAKHYLEGLLKIPFGILCCEPILNRIPLLLDKIKQKCLPIPICSDINYIQQFINKELIEVKNNILSDLNDQYKGLSKQKINNCIRQILSIVKKHSLSVESIKLNQSKQTKLMYVTNLVQTYYLNPIVMLDILHIYSLNDNYIDMYELYIQVTTTKTDISKYLINIHTILDNAIYGHQLAKRQVERVIGQWISGEQTGYTLGFEGPPGVGKTSLAKEGIAKCLLGANGTTRPFAFIAIGGEPNSSTLVGHNYTYVGSNWGKIVDVLMQKKIMNPIFYIDELDKISKTEQGREIIGILTHIIDSTQNMHFQDRFFSGIDLDISKALFIFSYNDVNCLDRILLDRIHRIQFKHLRLDEKIVIVNKYILPSICKDMNLLEHITISDAVIEFIIQEYTNEPGVRKLKELLFEILGEINLEILHGISTNIYPIDISKEMVATKYLKERTPVRIQKVLTKDKVGRINGLWANSQGQGGIITIECCYILSNTLFELKLTGSQGDVMKESMTVAKNLAWSLIPKSIQKNNLERFEATKNQGVHIHAPEGATPKDGPSAGTAITTALYSLFLNKPIRHDVAITGEINLSGRVTAIGGLDLKILGGIRAGVKRFLFPKENQLAFNKFMEKHNEDPIIEGIEFYPVEEIEEVFKLVF